MLETAQRPRYLLVTLLVCLLACAVMRQAEARTPQLERHVQAITAASAPLTKKLAACAALSRLGAQAYVALPLLKQAHRQASGKYKAAVAATIKRIEASTRALQKRAMPLARACRQYRLDEEVDIKLPRAGVVQKATIIARLRDEAKVRYQVRQDMNVLHTQTRWVHCKKQSKSKGYILKTHTPPQKSCKRYPAKSRVKVFIDIADPRASTTDDEESKGVVLAHDFNGNKALVRFKAKLAGKQRVVISWFTCKLASYQPYKYFIKGKSKK